MDSEKIYFDEEVKGHKLLVTSHAIVFKGKRFETSAVDGVSTAVFRQSVNAIPSASSYTISITSQGNRSRSNAPAFFGSGRANSSALEAQSLKRSGVGSYVMRFKGFRLGTRWYSNTRDRCSRKTANSLLVARAFRLSKRVSSRASQL
jgi:hypothetical protein